MAPLPFRRNQAADARSTVSSHLTALAAGRFGFRPATQAALSLRELVQGAATGSVPLRGGPRGDPRAHGVGHTFGRRPRQEAGGTYAARWWIPFPNRRSAGVGGQKQVRSRDRRSAPTVPLWSVPAIARSRQTAVESYRSASVSTVETSTPAMLRRRRPIVIPSARTKNAGQQLCGRWYWGN